MDIKTADIVLCAFYFSDLKATKNRPVLVIKDNLPFDDFIGLPISSQLDVLHDGEFEIDNSMFAYGSIPKKSKLMFRKPFVVSKSVVVKKYGSITPDAFKVYHRSFCEYFCCG